MKTKEILFLLIFTLYCIQSFSYQKKSDHLNLQDSLTVIKMINDADACAKSGNAKCKKALVNALSLAEKINSPYLKSICNIHLASAERKYRNEQLTKYDQAAVNHARASINDSLLLLCLLNYTADCCLTRDIDRALKLKEEATALQKKTASQLLKMKTFFETGHYYNAINDFDAAKDNFDKALTVAKEMNNAKWIATAKRAFFSSEVHGLKKEPQTGYIFDAYYYFKNSKSDVDAAHCLYIIGRAYMLNGNVDKAMEYFDEAVSLYIKSNYLIEAAEAKLSIAELCLADNKKIKKGLFAATEAERLYNTFAYGYGKIKSLIYLGRLYNADQQPEKASYYFSLADAQLKQKPDKQLQLLYLAGIVEKYRERKRLDLAKDTPTQAFLLQKQLVPTYIMMRFAAKAKTNGILSNDEAIDIKKFIKTGNIDTAIWNKKKDLQGFNPLTVDEHSKDSNYNVAFIQSILEVETKYKTRIKDDSLKNILNQNKIARLKIERQNWLMLLFSVITFAIAVILYLINRARKKALQQKHTIALLKEEADHRVKNTFSNINKIIHDVKNKTLDSAGIQLLEQRITPLQKLYQFLGKKASGLVELQPYFETIAETLQTSYEFDSPVNVIVNAPISMKAEKASTLGLIINELLTNAFKYAFTNGQAGIVSVDLLKEDNERLRLTVKDNGKGMAEPDARPTGTGLLQVQALAQQLDADFNMHNENGSVFEFVFKA